MGKVYKENKLQSYINGLREQQEHQYSHRVPFGFKPYDYSKASKADAWMYFLNGGFFLLGGFGYLLAVLHPLWSGDRITSGRVAGIIALIAVMGFGVLQIFAGVKVWKRAKW